MCYRLKVARPAFITAPPDPYMYSLKYAMYKFLAPFGLGTCAEQRDRDARAS